MLETDGAVPPGTDAGPDTTPGTDADTPTRDADMMMMGTDAGPPPTPGPTCQSRDLPLPAATGPTYYVSSSLGNDAWSGTLPEPNAGGTDGPRASFDVVAELANAATPGTHILLRRGDTWSTSSNWQIGSAAGTESEPIVVGAYGEGAHPLISASGPDPLIVRGDRDSASAYLRIDGIHFDGAGASIAHGIYVGEGFHPNEPHHITLSNLIIENFDGGMVMYGNDNLIHGSRFSDNVVGQGLFVQGDDITIRYSDFDNNGPPTGVFEHALYISNCTRMLFECNEVHNGMDGVKVRRPHDSVFRYNILHDLDATGIHLGGDSTGDATNNRIEGNLIYDTRDGIVIKSESGVQTAFTDGLVIANNILHSSRTGVGEVDFPAYFRLSNAPSRNVSIVNNLLYGIVDDHGVSISATGPNIVFANNIIATFDGGQNIVNIEPTVTDINNLTFSSAAEFQALNLVDPENADFTPTSASTMLIDQGMDASAFIATDFLGAPRPVGSAFDIGPHEYAP